MFNHLLTEQYRAVFEANNLICLEEFTTVKQHVKMQCTVCKYEFAATPLSKVQNVKKHGKGGCKQCTNADRTGPKREAVLRQLLERGITPIDEYDGQQTTTVKLTWHNSNCGHTFTAAPGNILHRGIDCTVCGNERRADVNRTRNEAIYQEWLKDAPAWKIYKGLVRQLSLRVYKANKHIINPNNYPLGKCGVEGAYQLDHIVPTTLCFRYRIPYQVCASLQNLQMLPWRENASKNAKVDRSFVTPAIFNHYIKDHQMLTADDPFTLDEMKLIAATSVLSKTK